MKTLGKALPPPLCKLTKLEESTKMYGEGTSDGGMDEESVTDDRAVAVGRVLRSSRPSRESRGSNLIAQNFDMLEAELSMLSETIGAISDKLQPILSPQQPEPGMDPSKSDRESESDLARALRDKANSVGRMRRDLRDLVARVEL